MSIFNMNEGEPDYPDVRLFYKNNGTLITEKKFDEIDSATLGEEVSSMAFQCEVDFSRRLSHIYMCLLMIQYFPSEMQFIDIWHDMLYRARIDVQKMLEDSPSLAQSDVVQEFAYTDGFLQALHILDLEQVVFPEACPWTFEQALDDDFFPTFSSPS